MRLAVTSGYRYSLHAIALLAMLRKQGFEAVVCLNVSMLSSKRFKYYLARLGPRNLFQSWKTKVWDRDKGKDLHPEVRYISDYLKQNGINYFDLKEICKDSGCRFATVRSLNCDKALSILRKAEIDLVVYMGGGILRPSFIGVPRIGVLNGHGGPLPHFRGMNAAEWSMLHGVQPGTTVHFIDRGIDTGPILFFQELPIQATDTIPDVRGKLVGLSVETLLRGVGMVASGQHQLTTQDPEDGRQVLHDDSSTS